MPLILPSPPVRAIATREAIVLIDDRGETVGRIAVAATRLTWSDDGSTLAMLTKSGRLLTSRDGAAPVEVAPSASEMAWGPRGRLLFSVTGKGIYGGSPATLMVATGHSPAPSPDGTRLAFATDGPQGGVWTAAGDGSGARRLLKAQRTGGVSWSYDARWLAAVVNGRLTLIRSNGRTVRDLGPVSDPTVRWSPGAAELFARREKGWSVYSFLRDSWTDVPFSSVPQWSGPSRLVGIVDGKAMEANLRRETTVLADAAEAVATINGIFQGASFPDPFARAPRPTGGLAWKGQILSFDPVGGWVSMRVDSETDTRGRETVLATAARRRARVPASPLSRRLTVLPETDAWLVVDGENVTDAYLPDAPTEATPAVTTRMRREARATEYDGVSLDRVVVPMVYPILLKKRQRYGGFLDARDGGGRRHHGNDLMGAKMTPLLACFDGVVRFGRTSLEGASNALTLESDDGWSASYLHVNNDTPGTDDGRGSMRFAFPADLQPGDRVRAGEVIAWCGDSGNAERTDPHLHFEIYDTDGNATLDPHPSLAAATMLKSPRYTDPDPSLRAARGQLRWDGVVTSVDLAKRTVAMELTGEGRPGGPPHRNLRPRIVYLEMPAGATIRYRGADLAYPLDALQPGMRFSAIGVVQGGKLSATATSMALAAS